MLFTNCCTCAIHLYIKLGFCSTKDVLILAQILLAYCEIIQFIQLLDNLRAFSESAYFILFVLSIPQVYQ